MHRFLPPIPFLLLVIVACRADAALTVGGWNSSRGGADGVSDGSEMSLFRAAIAADHPGIVYTGTSTLTSTYLSSLDVVLLSSVTGGTGGTSAIAPLTGAEQAALLSFVLAGHEALIFVDNDTYAGSPISSDANNSLLAPFGLHATGTLTLTQFASVTNPLANPLTNGPYGVVHTLQGFYVGEFDNLNGAANLANWPNGPGLAYLPRGALGPGSGPVMFVSDTMMANGIFGASDNSTLIRNAFAVVPEPSTVFLAAFAAAGLFVAFRRRHGYRAVANASLFSLGDRPLVHTNGKPPRS